MNLFIIQLKDQPGTLAGLAEVLATKGINIESIGGIEGGGTGMLALLTNDEDSSRKALAEAGYTVREIEVATTALEHKPGTFAAAARKLADAGINVTAVLPIPMAEGKVGVAFATDNPARARELLGSGTRTGIEVG
jgi:hypothetical protein